ncbi:unnamed protein product [Oppiella nova]|uniref:Uncharacterized protein n=1 Tax=Oppiella nova TaxID=334625 RepID=A0A7R9QX42_9ACAR|nr:unnamed protein product [Oppiella nova]CAG2177618.1 unnamed protein product [Oppiella nova]
MAFRTPCPTLETVRRSCQKPLQSRAMNAIPS